MDKEPRIRFHSNHGCSQELTVVVQPRFSTNYDDVVEGPEERIWPVFDKARSCETNLRIVRLLLGRLPRGHRYHAVFNTNSIRTAHDTICVDHIVITIHIEPHLDGLAIAYDVNGVIDETGHHLAADRVVRALDVTQRPYLKQIKAYLESKLPEDMSLRVIRALEEPFMLKHVDKIGVNCISSERMSQVEWNEITAGASDIMGEGYGSHPMFKWDRVYGFERPQIKETSYTFTGLHWQIRNRQRKAYEEYKDDEIYFEEEDFDTWKTLHWEGL